MSGRADNTREALRMALYRIQRGRGKVVKDGKLSIAAVAREAGVSAALIHNHYPEVAEQIHVLKNQAYRAQRDAKLDEVKCLKAINRELRADLADLSAQLAKAASEIATLTADNERLSAIVNTDKVVVLPSPTDPGGRGSVR